MENEDLCRDPTLDEVKRVVFSVNGDSAGGPNGLTCKFYQSCWDIIGQDIFRMVQVFLRGNSLPKSITHTNLILLPKKSD